jgi:lactoylglutathione lyase
MAARKRKAVKKAPKAKAGTKARKPASNGKSAAKSKSSRAEPQAFRARAAHPSFTVNDLTKSIAFYCTGIGFSVGEVWTHEGKVTGVELRAGTVELYLSQDDDAKGWDRKKGVGASISFITAQKVDDVAARLKKAGYPLLGEPADMPWGARAFRVADPDGFLIGISS